MIPLPADHAESVARIDLKNLRHNLETLKRKAGVGQVMAVVKANAYGHGTTGMSRALEEKIAQLAVATVDEGIQLRKAGVEKPILVFGAPNTGTVKIYNEYRLTATVSQLNHFDMLAGGTSYHIRFDTGMRRAGFFPEQTGEVLRVMNSYPDLVCRGIYSHYATADEPGSEFVLKQHALFQNVRARFPADIPAHMSNSAAVLHYDVDHFDMIRPGIGLTGYSSGKTRAEGLKPVLDWETTLQLVRKIRKGEPVSYGGTWQAPRDGYLATLPVGFADGIPRALSNRLLVTAGNEEYPVVGNITMDCCMIFLGGKPLEEGTTVQLMGNRGWRADEYAAAANTITHEILCGLTQRIRRIYR